MTAPRLGENELADLIRLCNECNNVDKFHDSVMDLEWFYSSFEVDIEVLAYACYQALLHAEGEGNKQIGLTYFEGWYEEVHHEAHRMHSYIAPDVSQTRAEGEQSPTSSFFRQEDISYLTNKILSIEEEPVTQSKMQLCNELYQYIIEHPFVLEHTPFHGAAIERATYLEQECVTLKRKITEEASQEGGRIDHHFANTISTLERTIATFRGILELQG